MVIEGISLDFSTLFHVFLRISSINECTGKKKSVEINRKEERETERVQQFFI
jgi:hypothetical protein